MKQVIYKISGNTYWKTISLNAGQTSIFKLNF